MNDSISSGSVVDLDANATLLAVDAVNSTFHGTPDLHQWLGERDVRQIVVGGMTTNHCCETTARVGGDLGYEVFFVLDATHTFDRTGPDGVTLSADYLARANCRQPARGVRDRHRHRSRDGRAALTPGSRPPGRGPILWSERSVAQLSGVRSHHVALLA